MLHSQGAYSNFWCGITPQVKHPGFTHLLTTGSDVAGAHLPVR